MANLSTQARQMDAYQAARSALKELGKTEAEIEAELKELREKCGMDIATVQAWRPYGGARSFDELETWQRGVQIRQEYDELNYELRYLMTNILDAEDMTDAQRATAITSLADDFAMRAADIPDEVDSDIGMAAMADDEETDPKKKGGRLARLNPFAKKKAAPAPVRQDKGGSFVAFKEADGTWRFFSVYSNTFKDKAGEDFPPAAHKDFIAWADENAKERYPELWDWHIPVGATTYSDGRKGMGRVDFLDYQDGLAMAGGYFYPEFAGTAETLSKEKDLGVSHGYEYQKWALKDGTYAHYRTFEVSPLPRAKAANEVTLFLPDMATKEEIMQFSADKRAGLVAHHGEDKVKQLEATLTTAAATLHKEAGEAISYKELVDALEIPGAPPAAGAAAPSISVPSTAQPAAGGESTAVKALTDAVTQAVKEAVAPIETRLGALEGNMTERMDKAIADAFGPRHQPDPSKAPSLSSDNVANGNLKEVQAAKKGDQSPDLAGVPDELQWYMQNAPGLIGAAVTQASADAAIAAAGTQ